MSLVGPQGPSEAWHAGIDRVQELDGGVDRSWQAESCGPSTGDGSTRGLHSSRWIADGFLRGWSSPPDEQRLGLVDAGGDEHARGGVRLRRAPCGSTLVCE